MTISFKPLLALSILLIAISTTAMAQQQPTSAYDTEYGYHPCANEKEMVTKTCKKGDPCGKLCQAAEKKLKKCRIANNLPQHEAGGSAQKPDCSTASDLPGAPVDATPAMGNPTNPLQSNHF